LGIGDQWSPHQLGFLTAWLLPFAVASFSAAAEEAARVSYRWEEAALGEAAPTATGVAGSRHSVATATIGAHARCCAAGRGAGVPAARRAAIRRRWGWLARHHVGREGEGGGEGGGQPTLPRGPVAVSVAAASAENERERGRERCLFF